MQGEAKLFTKGPSVVSEVVSAPLFLIGESLLGFAKLFTSGPQTVSGGTNLFVRGPAAVPTSGAMHLYLVGPVGGDAKLFTLGYDTLLGGAPLFVLGANTTSASNIWSAQAMTWATCVSRWRGSPDCVLYTLGIDTMVSPKATLFTGGF